MGTFALQIQQFIDKTNSNKDLVVRAILMQIDSRLVNRSPVGDASYWKSKPPKGYTGGRFRGAWSMSIGSPSTSLSRVIDKDGTATIGSHASVVAAARAGDVIYLTNNLPYAQRIEQGWSRQAPVGLVALTVVEFAVIVDNAVNGVRAGTSSSDFSQGFESYAP